MQDSCEDSRVLGERQPMHASEFRMPPSLCATGAPLPSPREPPGQPAPQPRPEDAPPRPGVPSEEPMAPTPGRPQPPAPEPPAPPTWA